MDTNRPKKVPENIFYSELNINVVITVKLGLNKK